MRKVLVVITTAFVKYGGLTNSFMNYYHVMDKKDLQIDIASYNIPEEKLIYEIKKNGGCYYQLPDKRKNTISYLIKFKKICKKYDCVHIHGNSATMAGELVLAKLAGVKVRIAHCHTNQCMHPFLNKLCLPVFLHSYTDGLAVSKEAGSWLYKNEHFSVMNNVIDTRRFVFSVDNRLKIRKKYNIKDSTVVIGHVGKIYEAKNHEFLVKVFKQISLKNDMKLLLVGDGILRGKIEKIVNDLDIKDKVIFAGMQSDTSSFYSAMDFFMFPSNYEGFGLALLEAQASGLDCFASTAVPKECNVSGHVRYIDLKIDKWVAAFNQVLINYNSRKDKSNLAIKAIKQKGYDSILSAGELKKLYFK